MVSNQEGTELTAYFAGRCEPCTAGVCSYGALIRSGATGPIIWANAEIVGQGARCNVDEARYCGAVRCLEKLRALHEQKPEHRYSLATDSRKVVLQLSGELRNESESVLLDRAADLATGLYRVLTLRYVPSLANMTAHALAEQVLRRHGIPFSDAHGPRERAVR
jgi:ribonuclease HI